MERSDRFELRNLIPYNCDFSSHQDWRVSNSAKLIAHRHGDAIKSDIQTRPRQIQTAERHQRSNQISYKQAWRAKKDLQTNTFMDSTKPFQLIFSFLEPIANTELDTDVNDQGSYATLNTNAAISTLGMMMDPSSGAMSH